LGKPSPKRVPLATVEEILRLYQEQYSDFNVQHFHEKLREKHQIRLSYTWVKRALQMAGLCPGCCISMAVRTLGFGMIVATICW
jgi:hypothetical protein